MTLHIIDVLQGTDEWLQARLGMITASVVGQLITPKTIKPAANPATRALVAELAAERITQWIGDSYMSDDMIRGHLDEPYARDAYAQAAGHQTAEAGLLVRDMDGYQIGYSPDGLIGDDGLVEIKSRLPKKHLAAVVADEVPAENIAQCQAALLVSGRRWCDYVSFCGGMRLWIKRVYPDPRWRDAILTATAATERAITETIAAYHAHTEGLPMTERPVYQDLEIRL